MTSFTDTVRFCFPSNSDEDTLFPDDNQHRERDRELESSPSNGGGGRPKLSGRGSSTRFLRPEEDDLSRGVLAFSFKHAVRSYLADWALAAVLWGSLALLNRSPGHKREFSLNDISIQHSFAEHERVPPYLLAFISVGIPALILLPISTFVARSKWDIHNAFIGLFMSYTMTGVVTQLIKMSVGRPRPDLIARCLPLSGAADHPVFGLSTYKICTTTKKLLLDDGFKSFPSGHSSLSFAGLGFLACYLAGKMHLWDKRGHRTRAWWAMSPLLGGIMVAISRTEDNRHHWQDVLVGSILGMFIAWVSYRSYYPSFRHRHSHLPLAPRAQNEMEMEDPEEDDQEGLLPRRSTRLADEANPRPSEEEAAWRGAAGIRRG